VSCRCTLDTIGQVTATLDNCDDDPRLPPLSTRSCGIECESDEPTTIQPPTTTRPPTTTTTKATTLTPPIPVCRWTTGNFTACSATCEGTQTRNVTCLCVLPSGSTIVLDDIICADQDPTIKPLEDRSCGDALCPGDCGWVVGEFSECSATCEGVQVRSVLCQCTMSGGITMTSSGLEPCENETAPLSTQSCSGECPTPVAAPECTWVVGPWMECSASCSGMQNRPVSCQCTLSNETTTVDPGSAACVGDEPSASQECNGDCPPSIRIMDMQEVNHS
jgi:hypothetical protein